MAEPGLQALHRRVAGIDVHRMLPVVTVLIEQDNGSMQRQACEFGAFRSDCRALAEWLRELKVELVVMESTGIYWKSVYAHLENAGILAWVVNAHRIKHVPGRKTVLRPISRRWSNNLPRSTPACSTPCSPRRGRTSCCKPFPASTRSPPR